MKTLTIECRTKNTKCYLEIDDESLDGTISINEYGESSGGGKTMSIIDFLNKIYS